MNLSMKFVFRLWNVLWIFSIGWKESDNKKIWYRGLWFSFLKNIFCILHPHASLESPFQVYLLKGLSSSNSVEISACCSVSIIQSFTCPQRTSFMSSSSLSKSITIGSSFTYLIDSSRFLQTKHFLKHFLEITKQGTISEGKHLTLQTNPKHK